jgi:uncharacterized damage-inducible protein DinB
MTTERVEPPLRADERTMLTAWLDHQRAILLRKCEGLPPERLVERAVPPSSLSLLGLVRHLADVERVWFRCRFAGEDVPLRYFTQDDPDRDFDDVRPDGVEEAFAAWRAECDEARRIVAAAGSLDDLGREPRGGQPWSLRWLLLHLVEEYARHNGHADLLRERIDGMVGD